MQLFIGLRYRRAFSYEGGHDKTYTCLAPFEVGCSGPHDAMNDAIVFAAEEGGGAKTILLLPTSVLTVVTRSLGSSPVPLANGGNPYMGAIMPVTGLATGGLCWPDSVEQIFVLDIPKACGCAHGGHARSGRKGGISGLQV